MVVIKYIGKTTDFVGKTMWEILGNLKNFGVGRTVVRSRFERYPEKSFFRILAVRPQPSGNEFDVRKVEVDVERTFRGRTNPVPGRLLASTYKTDFRLLSKEEEKEYCKITNTYPDRYISPMIEMPPMMKKVLFREYTKKGMRFDKNMMLEIAKVDGFNKIYHWEEPDKCSEVHSFSLDVKKTSSPSLYTGLDFSDTPKSEKQSQPQ